MSRPDDIPQDVWAAAERWMDVQLSAGITQQEVIALAIMDERTSWQEDRNSEVVYDNEDEWRRIETKGGPARIVRPLRKP